MGDLASAETEIDACLLARAPARAKEWLAMVQLYRRAGISEGVLARIDQFIGELSATPAVTRSAA
jgi:hypothetical protein